MSKEQSDQRKNATDKLDALAKDKLELKRPVFFIPGWTDESCICWITPYLKRDICLKEWVAKVVKNPEMTKYVSFSTKESKSSKSFFDFGDILKEKIWDKIGKKTEFDLVGHSMGGLDAVAAITDEEDTLLNVNKLITVATPHQGSELGEIGPIFRKYSEHIASQCVNLDPDQPAIKLINKPDVREKLLNRVKNLYCLMGTRDQAVMRSARFNKEGIDSKLYEKKVEILVIDGATHSQKYGITQDPRTILAILKILLDIELEKPKYNYGYLYKRN